MKFPEKRGCLSLCKMGEKLVNLYPHPKLYRFSPGLVCFFVSLALYACNNFFGKMDKIIHGGVLCMSGQVCFLFTIIYKYY